MKYLVTIYEKNGNINHEFIKEAKNPSCAVANLLVNYRYPLNCNERIMVQEYKNEV